MTAGLGLISQNLLIGLPHREATPQNSHAVHGFGVSEHSVNKALIGLIIDIGPGHAVANKQFLQHTQAEHDHCANSGYSPKQGIEEEDEQKIQRGPGGVKKE